MATGPRPLDPVDRAHLTGVRHPSPPIHRYAPSADLADLVDRFWIPVWDVPEPQTQRTLQHPCCLVVVSDAYATFHGVVPGLASVTLEGTGWAVGTMLAPGAGALVYGAPVGPLVGTSVDLGGLPGLDAPGLVAGVRAAMAADPHDPGAHLAAIALLEGWYRGHLPLDEAGRLVNEVTGWLRDHPEVTRVDEVAQAFGLSERRLQRLVERRVGLTPKWLIQRRRLHDAVHSLKRADTALADLAADLGYVDQAHFSHDFKAVVGLTPGEYLADQDGSAQGGAAARG